ncbi:MAG: S-methyl-5-thioribose-1-phosphate isomerase [Candidatus Omnitrophica bacterium]|nr:S-methyl-5-thioribose-1-phosphate isomerase [Candidatus Omnitrophota bacterium]
MMTCAARKAGDGVKTDQIKRTIWIKDGDSKTIQIIDQRFLPHQFVVEEIKTVQEMASAIRDMHLRGAPLIGVGAAFGIYLATLRAPQNQTFDAFLEESAQTLVATRPTAVNLKRGVEHVLTAVKTARSYAEKIQAACVAAQKMAAEDVKICRNIGRHGLTLIQELANKKQGKPVHILTHCNAGWLACVEWGTATSAIYQAFEQGIPIHVWVDETRPRIQGASLTAWEMAERGIPHTVITDSTSGHLMQRGLVDMVIVGTDRTTRSGDVANKIGTYMVALAAKENRVPFYVAVPSTSIDWELDDGVRQIPIEERSAEEVTHIQGFSEGQIKKVRITPEVSQAVNYAFDVTPRHLVTGLITERGIAQASREGLIELFPEHNQSVPGTATKKGTDYSLSPFSAADEGVIKFNCEWIRSEPIQLAELQTLNAYRKKLFDLGLIGVYPDGVGFGNLSVRLGQTKEFVISGTQTGGLPELTGEHYVRILDYSFSKNWVRCQGSAQASSESLTHAMIYELDSSIGAVVHVHHQALWKRLMGKVPTTDRKIAYGTPEMALEVKRLCENSDLRNQKILVMAGHEDGVISFGRDLQEASDILLNRLNLL